MMKLRTFFLAAAAAGALASTAAMAHADEVLIQAQGLWNAGTATTAYSQVGDSFSASFDVSNPTANPAYDFTNFTYFLNGVKVNAVPTSIEFFDVAENGLYDINFGGTTVSLYGADIGSTGTFAPPSFNAATAALNGGAATGNAVVTVTNVTPVSAAPEPGTWVLMFAGVGLAGLALRSRRPLSVSKARAA